MPYSFVMDFYAPEQEIVTSSLNSRIISAFLLKVIEDFVPDLSQYLHDQKKEKSFTVRIINLGKKQLRLRFTLLDEGRFGQMSRVLVNCDQGFFYLQGIKVRLAKVLCSPESDNFWANYVSYDSLFKNASVSKRNFLFNIDTPLVFKQNENYQVFPLPELFFRSLHRRWNAHSENKFLDDWLDFLPEFLSTGYFNLGTDVFRDKQGINFIGCIGKVEYRLEKKSSEELIHYINVLADYAYYSGVGYKTAMGMGQVHRLVKGDGDDKKSA